MARLHLGRFELKASDISDIEFLSAVDDGATSALLLEERFPDVPPKVLWAKRKKLIKRGLMVGCDLPYCGCWPYEAV